MERLIDFLAELLNRALNATEERVIQSGLHSSARIGGQNRLRLRDLHFRQLGGLPPQRLGPGADARGDEAGANRAGTVHIVERGGGAEVGHQHRAAIGVVGAGAVGDAVRAQGFGVVETNVHAGLDARAHHHRFQSEEFDQRGAEGIHHLRHHRADDHIVHIVGRVIAQSQELRDHQTVFV